MRARRRIGTMVPRISRQPDKLREVHRRLARRRSARFCPRDLSRRCRRVTRAQLFAAGLNNPLSRVVHSSVKGKMGMHLSDKIKNAGATGYILLWLLGIPLPILFLIFLLRGCT